MEDLGVYNSTTISYENSGGLRIAQGQNQPNGARAPWNLSEFATTPPARSRWFHWLLLMGGSVTLGLGLIVIVIGVYNQHYYDPDSHNVTTDKDFQPPSHWKVTMTGFGLALIGSLFLLLYCKLVNANMGTNRGFLCNPLERTRSALRQVVTKPRYQSGRQSSNLLRGEAVGGPPILTQYNAAPDLAFRNHNGDVNSEEKAILMANEIIDELPSSSCEALLPGNESSRTTPSTNSSSRDPRIILHPFAKASASRSRTSSVPKSNSPLRFPTPPLNAEPPVRPPRHKYSSPRRELEPSSANTSHYKPRHFAGHGYGQAKLPPTVTSPSSKAPLASLEDITPSLRSSFASVMMHPPSNWNSDESFDSTIMINLPGAKDEFQVPDSEFDMKFDDFRVSPGRKGGRKGSLSSLSVQSAL